MTRRFYRYPITVVLVLAGSCSNHEASKPLVGSNAAMIRANEGGTVTEQGAELEIPAGALQQDTLVTLRLLGASDDGLPAGVLQVLGVAPEGTRLDERARLRVPLTTAIVSSAAVVVYRFSEATWQKMEVAVSTDDSAVTLWITRFEQLAIAVTPEADQARDRDAGAEIYAAATDDAGRPMLDSGSSDVDNEPMMCRCRGTDQLESFHYGKCITGMDCELRPTHPDVCGPGGSCSCGVPRGMPQEVYSCATNPGPIGPGITDKRWKVLEGLTWRYMEGVGRVSTEVIRGDCALTFRLTGTTRQEGAPEERISAFVGLKTADSVETELKYRLQVVWSFASHLETMLSYNRVYEIDNFNKRVAGGDPQTEYSIIRRGSYISYWVNGKKVYTSETRTVEPLVATLALHEGTQLTEAKLLRIEPAEPPLPIARADPQPVQTTQGESVKIKLEGYVENLNLPLIVEITNHPARGALETCERLFCGKSVYSCAYSCGTPSGGISPLTTTYKPESGLTGRDSLTFVVRSQFGTVSAPLTLDIDVTSR